MADETDTRSAVARVLRAHEWRTESGGVRCRCRALLPTVTEYHDHQAAMLAEAGLLREALPKSPEPIVAHCDVKSPPSEVRDADDALVGLVVKHCERAKGHDGAHHWPALLFGNPGWSERPQTDTKGATDA